MRVDLRDIYNEIVALKTYVQAETGELDHRVTVLEGKVNHTDERDTGAFTSNKVRLDDHENRLRMLESAVSEGIAEMRGSLRAVKGIGTVVTVLLAAMSTAVAAGWIPA